MIDFFNYLLSGGFKLQAVADAKTAAEFAGANLDLAVVLAF
ncbi:hypothetical protein ACFPYJ_06635 [Paenibacillus solisilvae]|uniref:Uncharacterized protein n=1 Tax=Paenibacillus solisilvae TaxID=2486751 RepID=A0ABW0VSE1_9BACL